jgi:hypothetical protein
MALQGHGFLAFRTTPGPFLCESHTVTTLDSVTVLKLIFVFPIPQAERNIQFALKFYF